MRVFGSVLLAIIIISGPLVVWPGPAAAQTGESQVTAALDELHRWLGDNENGQAWRRFLKSDDLAQQLEKGAQADRTTVREILNAYSGETQGLTGQRFIAVRKALKAWLDELPLMRLEELPQAARDAKQQYKPITDDGVAQAKKRLTDAMAGLDQLLQTGSSKNTEKWYEFLRRDEVEEQLQAEGGPNWKVLQSVSLKYYENVAGLEHPKFMAVRVALRGYADAVLFSSNEKSQEYYEQYLDELATRLESYAEKPSADDAIMIGKTVGWLERFGQAEDLVAAVRQYYSHPNLFVQVSEDMMKTGLDTNVDKEMTVRENILGTSIRGDAHMIGRATVDLVPSAHSACVDIVLSGTTTSDNVGRNGPVTIYSSGVTTIDARKRMMVSATGITVEPAQAKCRTRSRITSIAGSAIAQNIAWNRVRQSKGRAEAIASQRGARRAETEMDGEAGELLSNGADMFANKFRNPLLRRDAFPQVLNFSTTDDYLHVVGLRAGANQLAAPGEPPALTENHDLGVRLHESFAGNLSQAALGGVTLTDERLVELVEQLTGTVPEEMAITEDTDPWSITFDSERPIDTRFDDQNVTISIRGKKFARGAQELRNRLKISATYKLERIGQGIKLTRQGEVEIDFPRSKRLSASQVAMKTFMKKRFEDMFKTEIASEGIELPGQFQEAGKLTLQQLYCDDGWLALGWHHPPLDARTAKKD